MNSRFTWRALSPFVFCWGGLQRVGRHRTFIQIWRGWHIIEWFQPGVPHSLSHSSYYKPSRKVNVYGTWAADVLFMSRSLPILWGSFSPLFFWFPKFDARPDFNCDDNSRRSGGQRRRLLYCESPINTVWAFVARNHVSVVVACLFSSSCVVFWSYYFKRIMMIILIGVIGSCAILSLTWDYLSRHTLIFV